ncbi:MAG: NUDIX hydrolase [Acidimicrobiales bacterium]
MTTPRLLGPGGAGLRPSADLAEARALLTAWAPPSADQAAVRDRMVAFVDGHGDALDRSCAPGHLTGSAFVVDAAGERALLLRHTKLRRWLQPGGHADGDANLAHVAWREATEETGIAGLTVVVPPLDVDVHRVEPPGEAPHDHLDVRFLVVAPPGAAPIGNHESEALRWVTADELEALADEEGLRRLATAGFALARRLLRS